MEKKRGNEKSPEKAHVETGRSVKHKKTTDSEQGLVGQHEITTTANPLTSLTPQTKEVVETKEKEAESPELPSGLKKLLKGGDYIIYNPPLNSSGDIYHILGFMAVLDKQKLPLPKVKIAYHKKDKAGDDGKPGPTKMNADRGLELANAIGFGSNVELIEVSYTKSQHLNPVAKATRKEIRKTEEHAPLLDQKSTSSMISMLMDAYGPEKVYEAIEGRLAKYGAGKEPSKEAQETSQKWIDEQLAKITESVKGAEKILLINARNAENQEKHDFSPEDVAGLQEQLTDKYKSKVATHVLYCGGGYKDLVDPEKKGPLDKATSTNAFTGTAEGVNVKVQHLQLLCQIKNTFGDKLVGIVGTTSGTLDAAALLGIETLSLHQFARSKKDGTLTMNEQDQRELLMDFKKVLDRSDLGDEGLLKALDAMIKEEEISPFKPWGETRTNINRAFTQYQTEPVKDKGEKWSDLDGVEDALKEILKKYTAESKDTDKS